MKRFIEGEARSQSLLFPERLDDYVAEDNPVRAIEVFAESLDLGKLGFEGVEPEATGRPAYHPAVLLKIYIYGYLNRIQSSRRLERETQRNVELIWLTGKLMPDFKTIADFRKDNGPAIRAVCREFIVLCRRLELFAEAVVAVDGSKFKAVNNRDKNFTDRKLKARMEQLEESIGHYLAELDRADREPTAVSEDQVSRLKDKIAGMKAHIERLNEIGAQMKRAPDGQVGFYRPWKHARASPKWVRSYPFRGRLTYAECCLRLPAGACGSGRADRRGCRASQGSRSRRRPLPSARHRSARMT
jgi:transposase